VLPDDDEDDIRRFNIKGGGRAKSLFIVKDKNEVGESRVAEEEEKGYGDEEEPMAGKDRRRDREENEELNPMF